jgi:hypothetical protein
VFGGLENPGAFVSLGGPKLAFFGMPREDENSCGHCEQDKGEEVRELCHYVTLGLSITFV